MLRKSALRRVWLGGTGAAPALGLDLRSPTGQFVNVIPEGTQPRRTTGHFNPTPQANSLAATHFAHAPELRHMADGVGMSVSGQRVPLAKAGLSKWSRRLRSDIYDELLKLPLRYALHDFRTLQAHIHAVPATAPAPSGAAAAAASASPSSPAAAARGALPHHDEQLPPGVYRSTAAAAAAAVGQPPSDASAAPAYYAVAGRDSAVGYAAPLGPADPLDVLPFFVHRTPNGQLPGKVHSMHNKNLMPAFYMRIQNVEGDLFRFEEELMKIFPTKKIFVRSHTIYVYNVNLDGRSVLHHWLLGLGF